MQDSATIHDPNFGTIEGKKFWTIEDLNFGIFFYIAETTTEITTERGPFGAFCKKRTDSKTCVFKSVARQVLVLLLTPMHGFKDLRVQGPGRSMDFDSDSSKVRAGQSKEMQKSKPEGTFTLSALRRKGRKDRPRREKNRAAAANDTYAGFTSKAERGFSRKYDLGLRTKRSDA